MWHRQNQVRLWERMLGAPKSQVTRSKEESELELVLQNKCQGLGKREAV